MLLEFKWDGSYNSTKEFMGKLPRSFEREKTRVMKKFGVETLTDLQSRILSGNTSPALTAKYLKWKLRHGLLPGTLLRTKEYVYHIKIEYTESGFYIYPYGMEKPILSEDKDGNKTQINQHLRSYEYIAARLEYGSKRMPARPHWMPTARRARARFPGVMRTVLQAAFDRARSGGVVTSVSGYSAQTGVADSGEYGE